MNTHIHLHKYIVTTLPIHEKSNTSENSIAGETETKRDSLNGEEKP